MSYPLDGIHLKLDRADENIRNLETELRRFLDESEYPSIPTDDIEAMRTAIDYHRNRRIPVRFGILVGEIVHHLRSCLDHLVWNLSSEAERRDRPKKIQFPIFKERPLSKNEISRYEGQINGVRSVSARIAIENLQPYHCSPPEDSILLVVNDMDVFDKHREIAVCHSIGRAELPAQYVPADIFNKALKGEDIMSDLYPQVKKYGQIKPQVTLENPRWGNRQVLIPTMLNLRNGIRDIIDLFEKEFSP